MNRKKQTLSLVMTGAFTALVIIMSAVPNLGYIQLFVIKATLVHIPVILGSVLLGPACGAALGMVFGVTSLVNNTFNPSLLSFAFSPFYSLGDIHGNGFSILIALVPRILTGVTPYYVYHLVKGQKNGKSWRTTAALSVAGICGSMTNTVLVMHLIYICFRTEFAQARQMATEAVYGSILGIIAMNGLPEACVAGVVTACVGSALMRAMKGGRE